MHASIPLGSHYPHQYPSSSSLQQSTQPSHSPYSYHSPAPMGERPAFEMQGAAGTSEYPGHRDYNAHYASSSSSTVASSQSYLAPPPHHVVPFFPPSLSSYGGSEARPSYGRQGKQDVVSSQGYATAPQYPPPPVHRSGMTSAFQHPDGATGMYASQRGNGWAPAPPPPPR